MNTNLKVLTILGTRPEIIRLSVIMNKLDQFFSHKVVHTGQNYDYELNEIFFMDLGVRRPDHFLCVETTSLGAMLGDILVSVEKIFIDEKPDAVLILGDTNSSVSAIMARRMKIPIFHMEAGNRCFDMNVPEEINRKIVDHISDFNLVYTEHARRHLLSEGIPPRRIYLTGSPMAEVLNTHFPKIQASDVMNRLGLEKGKFFLASFHREENVDHIDNLNSLMNTLDLLNKIYGFPIIVSTHPRTRKRLESAGLSGENSKIHFMKPFGFLDYNNLQLNSLCVLSDSGTISEEAAILRFPAITVRNAIERPEALDCGNIIMTGLNPKTIIGSIQMLTTENTPVIAKAIPPEYQITDVSTRVLKLIMGLTKLSHIWDGIMENVTTK